VGKKAMEIEILQAARDEVKKAALVRRVHAMTGRRVVLICRLLGIGRATVYRPAPNRTGAHGADSPDGL
jgi:transcriptional regulator of acetoin/glycerol metabolism